MVRNYIREQEREEERYEQLSLFAQTNPPSGGS